MRTLSKAGILTLGIAIGALFVLHCGGDGSDGKASGAHRHPATEVDYDNASSGLTGTEVQAVLDELAGRAAVLQALINNLQTDVTSLQGTTGSLNTRLTAAEGSITSLDTRLSGMVVHDHEFVATMTVLYDGPGSAAGAYDLTGPLVCDPVIAPDATAVVVHCSATMVAGTEWYAYAESGGLEVPIVAGQVNGVGLVTLPWSSGSPILNVRMTGNTPDQTKLHVVGYERSWSP